MISKQEYLDILKDYLQHHFTMYELNDILRDYEEYFLNGELEGKSDKDIIEQLGSPKQVAKDLIDETKTVNIGHNMKKNSKQKNYKQTESYARIKDFTDSSQRGISNLFKSLDGFFTRVYSRFSGFFYSDKDHVDHVVQEETIEGEPEQGSQATHTPNRRRQQKPNGSLFRRIGRTLTVWIGRLFLLGVTLFLLFIACMVMFFFLAGIMFILSQMVVLVMMVPISIIAGGIHSAYMLLGLSGCLGFLGLIILQCVIAYYVFKVIRYIVISYISYVKTKLMRLRIEDKRRLLPVIYEGGNPSDEN